MSFPAQFELSSLDGSNGFTLNGIAGNDRSGFSVSSAGDINNDGFDDLIIGADGADINGNASGSSYVVFGKGTSFSATLNLSTLNSFTLNGVTPVDYSGRSVSSAGDINGDGFDDLIIGAFGADPNGSASGSSYLVFGKGTTFSSPLNLSTLNGTNGFILNGSDANDNSGRSVSNAGDINGDGFDDLIIGAFGADPNGTQSGESYVVFGKGTTFSSPLNLSTLNGTNGFTINGVDAYDYSGRSVSNAGDINGDGFDDLIIGAYLADPNGTQSGESYVVFGKDTTFSSPLNLSTLNGTNGFTINGVTSFDRSGFSVSSAGDINGDGLDDLIIGAYRADVNGADSGSIYVVFGQNTPFSSPLNLFTLNGPNGFTINGIAAGDRLGRSVSSAGDVNDDGIDDLIIGAVGADPNGSFSGSSYVVFGKNTPFSPTLNLSTLNGTNGFTLNGINAYDNSGYSVSSAGDVNGDGIDDLIIGAYGGDPNGGASGESYVVFGAPPPSISVTVSPTSVTEDGSDNLVYTFTRTRNTSSALNDVNFNVGGEAIFNNDYTQTGATSFNANSGTVNFNAGSATTTVTLDPTEDTIQEFNETAILTLAPGNDYRIGIPASATGRIINDDSGGGSTNPTITVTVSPTSVAENGSDNLVYTFTRTGSTGNPLNNVNVGVAGTATFNNDYTVTGGNSFNANTGRINFNSGSATATVTLDPLQDAIIETNETAILRVTSGTGYNVGNPASATGTIIDGGGSINPSVIVSVSPTSVNENGLGNLVYTFTRTTNSGTALNNVNFDVGGGAIFNDDYTVTGAASFNGTTGTVNFRPRATTVRVTVNPKGDTRVEPDETVLLTVTSGSGYTVGNPNEAEGAIVNDDRRGNQDTLNISLGKNGNTVAMEELGKSMSYFDPEVDVVM
ncbi:S-layer family protein [Gloeocapsa sp. PCC 73106]|uniref:beta strand repeat-containing protein n=1 Tax=Gloeocapsa sp. PCC 73106 TaxID=102232 RepID=UPI0002ACF2C7|nr:FG-GAP repeat protein [Gloeocapsa sp. PCC 73106]ELR96644.1 FG-GAP repeat protein [Gloeocapsa sp. PCC 73106]